MTNVTTDERVLNRILENNIAETDRLNGNKRIKSSSRRHWTKSEDERCKKAVLAQLEGDPQCKKRIDWVSVQAQMGGARNAKQCRERWRLKLNPLIRTDRWSTEEDDKLISLFQIYSSRWVTISKKIKGRSEHACKSRWKGLVREKRRLLKLKKLSTEKVAKRERPAEIEVQNQPAVVLKKQKVISPSAQKIPTRVPIPTLPNFQASAYASLLYKGLPGGALAQPTLRKPSMPSMMMPVVPQVNLESYLQHQKQQMANMMPNFRYMKSQMQQQQQLMLARNQQLMMQARMMNVNNTQQQPKKLV